jgi:putative membrane protein
MAVERNIQMATPAPAALPDATKLAVDRTRLAYERTLMAWVRTATSLISFGFTIYKFFQYLHDNKQAFAGEQLIGPRGFALIMIGIGLVALAIATVEHRRSMQLLRTEYGHVVPYSLATLVAALIAALGILMFVAVVFRQ